MQCVDYFFGSVDGVEKCAVLGSDDSTIDGNPLELTDGLDLDIKEGVALG